LPEYLVNFFADLQNGTTASKIIASVLVIPIALLVRWIMIRALANVEIRSPELRLRWMVQIRNIIFVVVLLCLMIIWASEVRTMAISLVAFIVAIVLATKELILCVTGSFLKISTRAFAIGDRIEINGLRGDVIDQTLLGTQIMEVGPGHGLHQYTGRTITIPNSQFLTQSITNHNITRDYAIVAFTVPVKIEQDYQQAEQWLLQAANEVCGPYLDDARKHWAREQENLIDLPQVDPRVSLHMASPDQVDLIVRMPVPTHQRGGNSQQVLRKYLQLRQEAAENSPTAQ
jgi:small-conductance mechanosensitive channel